MSYPNSSPSPGSDQPISSGFNTQSEMGLPEVLQMCCLSRRSGQITFRSGESNGFIFIQQGRVLHAMCGPIEGEEAIYTMMTWPGGGFTLNEDILPHKKTVTLTWEQLLFEGARRADEGTLGAKMLSNAPVTTVEPMVSTRAHESQPKLIVTRPDLPPITFELSQEYTHVGRSAGNEISLPYPSISSRHCIFIMSGPDIVVRDLNSSNGTLVNDETINEAVLRPGDTIRVGIVEIKFEAGMKRPKLRTNVPPTRGSTEPLKEVTAASEATPAHMTVKLPVARKTPPAAAPVKDDAAYVRGVTAINYSDLAKPEVEQKSFPWVWVIGIVAVVIIAGAFYFFVFRH